MWNAFKKFDLDNNGSIDLKELNQVLGDAEVAEAMNLKDSAGAQGFGEPMQKVAVGRWTFLELMFGMS